jgi:hypothetical protein
MLTPNLVIGVLHGTVSDLVFVPMENGKICVKHRPARDFNGAIPGQLRLLGGGEADQRSNLLFMLGFLMTRGHQMRKHLRGRDCFLDFRICAPLRKSRTQFAGNR